MVILSTGRKFLLNNEDYFDNVNTNPVIKRILVGGYKSKEIVTLFDDADVLILTLCAEKTIKELKRKIKYISFEGGGRFKELTKYKCGTYRQHHYNTPANILNKSTILLCQPSTTTWSEYTEVWNCNMTLDEYMKKYSSNLRSEHYREIELREVEKFSLGGDDDYNL